MSSFLEFRHLALALPVNLAQEAVSHALLDAPYFQPYDNEGCRYLVFAEGGDNNVIDHSRSRRGRVSRRWYLIAAGLYDNVIRTVTRCAADHVISGNIHLQTRSRWTLPETYIRTYRNALDTAVSWNDASDVAPDLALKLEIPSPTATYDNCWASRESYAQHLARAGRLRGNGVTREVRLAPLASQDGLADLAWVTTLGNPDRAPAQTLRDITVNNDIDRLAVFAKLQRRAKGAA
jgi:hypothetical protein